MTSPPDHLPPLDPALSAAEPTLPPARVEALLAAVSRDVASEHGALATLRAWPTPRRLALAVGVTAAACGWVLAIKGVRPGLGQPAAVAGLLALAGGAVAGLRAALTPLSRGTPSAGVAGAAVLSAPLAGALQLLPGGVWPGMTWPEGPVPWAIHQGCLTLGIAVAFAVSGVVALLDRSAGRAPLRLVVAAGAGGLAGFGALLVECPLVDTAHLIGSHGAGGVLAAAVVPAVARALARR